jgi:phosphoglycolate phosphatase
MPAVASGFTVVFDLDGTLVDTAPDLVATLNVVFAREGFAPVPYELARNMVGGGAQRMIELGLRLEGRALPARDVDRMFDDFITYYAAHIADHSLQFPGLVGALDQLTARQCRLAVCTNKLEWLSRRLLETLGLSDRFAAICGQDTFGVAKPDPEMLRRTIKQAGGNLERAIMVGDSSTDIDTARAAVMPVIAVDFGYTETPVAQLAPDRIISHFDKLPGAVFELLGLRV